MTKRDQATRWRQYLAEPIDNASLAVFRMGFGLIATFAAIRFIMLGWVEELLVAPGFHFAWIQGLPMAPPWALYSLFALQALAGLAITFGRMTRLALTVWLISFVYIELIDKALYLNHYVLFTLLGIWLLVTPASKAGLNDLIPVSRWVLVLFRIQIISVYFWAGFAKLNTDWLLRAEPMRTWLLARVDLPLLGPFFELSGTAYAMAWLGLFYDLFVPLLLLFSKTRSLGIVLVLGFHVAVGLLFPIGVFPVLMVLGASLLLPDHWPRRWYRPSRQRQVRKRPLPWSGVVALASICTLLMVFPSRSYLHDDNPSWSERDYRFSWKVLLNEKTGLVDFRIVDVESDRSWVAHPRDYLSELQHAQMRTQPDLIRDFALFLQREHQREGRAVKVFADSWASLNGRPTQRLLDPEIDLTRPLNELELVGWIIPLGHEPLALETHQAGGNKKPALQR